jgi:hypothetical protein
MKSPLLNLTVRRMRSWLVLLLCVSGASAYAQVATTYTFSQSTGTYQPISGGSTLGIATNDDTGFPNLPIGFTFYYNGVNYTQFSVQSNGFIALGTTIASSYTAISTAAATNNIIAGLNRDLQGNVTTGELRYETIGTAPNRTLVIQWSNYRSYASTGDNYNFQIRLNETTNVIDVVYGGFTQNATNRTVQVGLRGNSNADFNNRTSTTDWSATTAGVANNNTISLTTAIIPPSGLTFTWTPPASCSGTPVAGTASSSVTNACPGTNFNLVLTGATSAPGISLIWQSSADGITFTNTAGVTSTYTTTQTDTMWYQAIVTCSVSGMADTSNIIQVNMNSFLNCYCTSNATSTFDDDIGQVTLGSLANPATAPSPLLNNPAANATYTNFTGLTPTDLERGLSYSASVLQFNSGGFYGCGVAMFIDFNQNGVFDASERVMFGQTATANPVTGTVTIPVTATLGITRMRVVLREGGTGSTLSACGTYTWGETEDYYVNILPEPPPCAGTPTPGTISANDTIVCSAVNYTLSLSGQTTGTDIAIQWQSSTDGITFANISGATSTSYTTSQTDTTWFQAIVTCTTSGMSDTTNIVQVSMESFVNCYCTSSATSTFDDDIGQVVVGSFANPTVAPTPLLNNPTAYSTYTNFTSTVAPVDLNQGLSYPGEILQINSGGFYACGVAMFIDFNQNGIFDASERVMFGQTGTANPVTGTINVPVTATIGQTRMRVVMIEGATGSTLSACGTYTWGETEDYLVNILPAPDTNIAATSLTGLTSGCGLTTQTVTANLQSQGTDTLFAGTTVYITYMDGTTTITDTIVLATNVAFGETFSHTFTTMPDFSVPGTYNVNVFVSLANDTIQSDDTLSMVVNSIATYSTFPYSEDFEASQGDWLASGSANQDWEWGVPSQTIIGSSPGCGTNIWTTGLATNYPNNMTGYLTSACFDFSALTYTPVIRFDNIYNTETGWEDYWLEYSTNGGTTWTKVLAQPGATNWYNNTGAAIWEGTSSGGWVVSSNSLSQVAGQSGVIFRFAFTSDGSVVYEGVGVDNIFIGENFIDMTPQFVAAPVSNCNLTAAESVTVIINNTGLDTITTFDVCFTIDGGTPVCETVVATILPNTSYVHGFAATADLSVVGSHDVVVYTSLIGDMSTCSDTLSVIVQNKPYIATYPYFEDFENGMGGWESGGTNNTWEFGTPMKTTIMGAASGVNAWANGGLGAGTNYASNEDSYVQSPCFNFTTLPADPWVGMKIWWNAEEGWDGVALQMSRDGATWVTVGAFNPATQGWPNYWYNDNAIASTPGGQGSGWSNTLGQQSNGYIQVTHPLDTTGFGDATSVVFRVVFGSDGIIEYEGVAFDNFAIGTIPALGMADTAVCGDYTVSSGYTTGEFEWLLQDTTTTMFVDTITTADFILTNPNLTDSTTMIYLTYMNEYGFSNRDTVLITLYSSPVLELGNDTSICFNTSVNIGGPSSTQYTYIWSTGDTVNAITVAANGNYMLTITDTMSGCTATDDIDVTVMVPVSLPITVNLCQGDTTTLDAGAGFVTYDWTITMDTTQTTDVFSSATYTVTVMDSVGCTSMDSVKVEVNPLPVVTASADDTICLNHSITLDAGPGHLTYLWSNNSTTQTISLTGTTLGSGTFDFVVTVSNVFGCQNSDTVTLLVDPCAGIDELENGNISLAPNPTSGMFTISFGKMNGPAAISIFTLDGKLMYTENVQETSGNVKAIDLTNKPSGIYYIQVTNGDSVWTEKLVIQ